MTTKKYNNGLYKTTSKKQDNKLTELWMLFNPINSSTNFDQKSGIVIYTFALSDDQKNLSYKIFEINWTGRILSVTTKKDLY